MDKMYKEFVYKWHGRDLYCSLSSYNLNLRGEYTHCLLQMRLHLDGHTFRSAYQGEKLERDKLLEIGIKRLEEDIAKHTSREEYIDQFKMNQEIELKRRESKHNIAKWFSENFINV